MKFSKMKKQLFKPLETTPSQHVPAHKGSEFRRWWFAPDLHVNSTRQAGGLYDLETALDGGLLAAELQEEMVRLLPPANRSSGGRPHRRGKRAQGSPAAVDITPRRRRRSHCPLHKQAHLTKSERTGCSIIYSTKSIYINLFATNPADLIKKIYLYKHFRYQSC